MDELLPGTCREGTQNRDFQPVNAHGRWCCMSCSEVTLWWDKDTDHTGRPIRPDVRATAHRIWVCASKTAQTVTGDTSHSVELMENTVAQVSRYLDRGCVFVFSRDIDGLLMLSFRRALRRRLAKLSRIESLGGVKALEPGRRSDLDTTSPRPSGTGRNCAVALEEKSHNSVAAICGLHLKGSR
jgi:hypothetical protein